LKTGLFSIICQMFFQIRRALGCLEINCLLCD